MDQSLWALLTGSVAVTALCGQRVFWGIAPQGEALPAVVLNIVSTSDVSLYMNGGGGLWRHRVQVDCYALDRPQARALARAVTTLLHLRHDEDFDLILFESEREDIEDAAVDRPSRISCDFIINWRPDNG